MKEATASKKIASKEIIDLMKRLETVDRQYDAMVKGGIKVYDDKYFTLTDYRNLLGKTLLVAFKETYLKDVVGGYKWKGLEQFKRDLSLTDIELGDQRASHNSRGPYWQIKEIIDYIEATENTRTKDGHKLFNKVDLDAFGAIKKGLAGIKDIPAAEKKWSSIIRKITIQDPLTKRPKDVLKDSKFEIEATEEFTKKLIKSNYVVNPALSKEKRINVKIPDNYSIPTKIGEATKVEQELLGKLKAASKSDDGTALQKVIQAIEEYSPHIQHISKTKYGLKGLKEAVDNAIWRALKDKLEISQADWSDISTALTLITGSLNSKTAIMLAGKANNDLILFALRDAVQFNNIRFSPNESAEFLAAINQHYIRSQAFQAMADTVLEQTFPDKSGPVGDFGDKIKNARHGQYLFSAIWALKSIQARKPVPVGKVDEYLKGERGVEYSKRKALSYNFMLVYGAQKDHLWKSEEKTRKLFEEGYKGAPKNDDKIFIDEYEKVRKAYDEVHKKYNAFSKNDDGVLEQEDLDKLLETAKKKFKDPFGGLVYGVRYSPQSVEAHTVRIKELQELVEKATGDVYAGIPKETEILVKSLASVHSVVSGGGFLFRNNAAGHDDEGMHFGGEVTSSDIIINGKFTNSLNAIVEYYNNKLDDNEKVSKWLEPSSVSEQTKKPTQARINEQVRERIRKYFTEEIKEQVKKDTDLPNWAGKIAKLEKNNQEILTAVNARIAYETTITDEEIIKFTADIVVDIAKDVVTGGTSTAQDLTWKGILLAGRKLEFARFLKQQKEGIEKNIEEIKSLTLLFNDRIKHFGLNDCAIRPGQEITMRNIDLATEQAYQLLLAKSGPSDMSNYKSIFYYADLKGAVFKDGFSYEDFKRADGKDDSALPQDLKHLLSMLRARKAGELLDKIESYLKPDQKKELDDNFLKKIRAIEASSVEELKAKLSSKVEGKDIDLIPALQKIGLAAAPVMMAGIESLDIIWKGEKETLGKIPDLDSKSLKLLKDFLKEKNQELRTAFESKYKSSDVAKAFLVSAPPCQGYNIDAVNRRSSRSDSIQENIERRSQSSSSGELIPYGDRKSSSAVTEMEQQTDTNQSKAKQQGGFFGVAGQAMLAAFGWKAGTQQKSTATKAKQADGGAELQDSELTGVPAANSNKWSAKHPSISSKNKPEPKATSGAVKTTIGDWL